MHCASCQSRTKTLTSIPNKHGLIWLCVDCKKDQKK